MPFGMEEAEMEARMVDELSERPGHVMRFKDYQIGLIAKALAAVIFENNIRIKYSLGSRKDDDIARVGDMLNTVVSPAGESTGRLEDKVRLAGIGLQRVQPGGNDMHLFGRLDELVYTSGSERLRHEFDEPKPLLLRLPDGGLFVLRDESRYRIDRNSQGKWELIG